MISVVTIHQRLHADYLKMRWGGVSQHISQEMESAADFSGSWQGLVADHGGHPEELLEQAAEGCQNPSSWSWTLSCCWGGDYPWSSRVELEEEVPTGAELTESAIVEAVLHREPEIVEVTEEPEDEQPDRRATFSLKPWTSLSRYQSSSWKRWWPMTTSVRPTACTSPLSIGYRRSDRHQSSQPWTASWWDWINAS